MVENTLETGIMGNNMEKEFILHQMDRKKTENGKRERE
jgi:hypothetical protein